MRAIGITDFLDRKFDCFPFEGTMAATFGEPERNMRILIYGKPGNGKTEFAIQLSKYLAGFTRVYYNSFEQGISKTLQDAVRRNHLEDIAGRMVFGDKETLEEIHARLKAKNSPHVCVLDSRDYMNLTGQQYRDLVAAFPHKCFIVLCWDSGGKPKGEHAKAIEFMVDVKIHVRDFVAYPRSRFGGNQKYVIWDRKPMEGVQLRLAV
jgi:hypothetical protein